MKKSNKWLIGGAVAGITASAAMYKATAELTKKLIYRNEIERTELGDEYEVIQLKNDKGLVLYGYLKEVKDAKRTLIMLHALNKNAESLSYTATEFEDILPQTNILLLDAAAHGTSDGYIRGFGYKEADDLEEWNNYVLDRFGDDQSIVIYGEGMGANTALNASGLGKLRHVKAIVSNGAYDSVNAYLNYQIFKKLKLNSHLAQLITKRVFKNETGMNLDDLDTVRLVKNNQIPTIFMHSKNDKDVPFRDVFELYNNNGGKAVLFPIKEDHFYDMNPDDDYSHILQEFLKENA